MNTRKCFNAEQRTSDQMGREDRCFIQERGRRGDNRTSGSDTVSETWRDESKEERIQSDSKGSLLWVCHWALREEAAEPSAEVGCSGSADAYGEGRMNEPYASLRLTCDGACWTCFTIVFLHFFMFRLKTWCFLARKSKRKTDSKPGVKQKKK